MIAIKIVPAECHDGCLDVSDMAGRHTCNVNPVGGSTKWRVDCDSCFTCIRVRDSKEEALESACAHIEDIIKNSA